MKKSNNWWLKATKLRDKWIGTHMVRDKWWEPHVLWPIFCGDMSCTHIMCQFTMVNGAAAANSFLSVGTTSRRGYAGALWSRVGTQTIGKLSAEGAIGNRGWQEECESGAGNVDSGVEPTAPSGLSCANVAQCKFDPSAEEWWPSVPWRHGNRHHEQNRPNRLTRKRDCRSTSSLMARAMLGGSGIWDEKVMNVVKRKDAPFLSPSSWIPKTTMYEMYFVAPHLKRTQNLNASGPPTSFFDRGKILCETLMPRCDLHIKLPGRKYCDPSAWICNHLDVIARIGFLPPLSLL